MALCLVIMKWFKHHTDAHNNLKFQKIFKDFGSEGYGLFWICVELVGREGNNFRVSAEKEWFSYLEKNSGIERKKIKTILQAFADTNLVDKKALNKGELYLPKLQERVDEYTDKVGRKSRQSPDIVGKEEKRTDKKRRDTSFSKKMFYKGLEVRKAQGKLWVLPPDGGKWLEFAGKEEEIEIR